MLSHTAPRRARWLTVARFVLTLLAAAGLAIDAYVHLDLAGNYAPIRTSTLSQAELFRAEAVVSILAGLLILLRPRRYSAAIGALVAGSALLVLLLYRYYDIGQLGPIPDMYEPVWFGEKTFAAIAESAAFAASVPLALLGRTLWK